ncbi:ribonuclease M5 [Aciduricibacillus chroicocephali]|uniref:Ribonuclease M5 n=1 Tax=Aciduricibacillus chroicocephali TaxID=3054939 RepID=A0ABY9KV70_9BACI|nr:ribonuclease M5 [Bacillaceae bacterium 44XB]
MKIKEVIVVEGKDDTAKIIEAVDADTIETRGSAINKSIMERIRHAKEKRGVIIFTDPDYPGERIRRLIDEAVPGCKHAYLTQDAARAKFPEGKSLGIEHASIEAIREALSGVYEVKEMVQSEIEQGDLIAYGLLGGKHASKRRERIGELLKLGHTNGKQLLKRLQMFQITKQEFESACEQVLKEEEDDR